MPANFPFQIIVLSYLIITEHDYYFLKVSVFRGKLLFIKNEYICLIFGSAVLKLSC